MGASAAKMDKGSEEQCRIFCDTYCVNEDVYNNAVATFKKMAGSTAKDVTRRQFVKEQDYPEDFSGLIFSAFDTDNSGSMSLSEFLVYMGLKNGGSTEQKLRGSFMLFDKDHSGSLERSEVIGCFQAYYRANLYRKYVDLNKKKPKDIALPEAQKNEIANLVGELFDKLDVDKSGTIDIQEFVNGFRDHTEVCQPILQF